VIAIKKARRITDINRSPEAEILPGHETIDQIPIAMKKMKEVINVDRDPKVWILEE